MVALIKKYPKSYSPEMEFLKNLKVLPEPAGKHLCSWASDEENRDPRLCGLLRSPMASSQRPGLSTRSKALGLCSAGGGLASGSWEKLGVSAGAGWEEGWKDRAVEGWLLGRDGERADRPAPHLLHHPLFCP